MVKQKILKIKVGDVYIDGKNTPVFKTYWRKENKKGGVYYETRDVAFPSEVELKKKEEQPKVETIDI